MSPSEIVMTHFARPAGCILPQKSVISQARRSFRQFAAIIIFAVAVISSGKACAEPQRPLLFIPGILGSRLSDARGDAVWGDRNSLLNFSQLELYPGSAGSALHVDGLVESINVLGPFWTIHQYDALIDKLHSLGYVDHENFFVFPYDWRNSNYDTAKLLEEFVASTSKLKNGKFDIVAHSMGGLVTRIWMIDHGGASKLNKVIYMGTPFQGSMNAFATLSDGWGRFANFIAGGLPTVRRVTLSFPSIYELFPTYDNCCRLGDAAQYTPLDILSLRTWTQRDWLPTEYAPGGPREKAFKDGLLRARKIGQLMRQPIANVEEIKFAGDVIDTKLWLYVPLPNQSWKSWSFRDSRGDGTVSVWSAANNFSTTAGTNPSFVEHATIFADKWLANKVARELVPDVPPPVRIEEFNKIQTDSGAKTMTLASVVIEPPVVQPGGRAILRLSLEFDGSISRGDMGPTARMAAFQQNLPLRETTTDDDVALRRLTFEGEVLAPTDEDTYRIDVMLPGIGVRASYLSVIANSRRRQ